MSHITIKRRLEALERPASDTLAVWLPDMPKPEGWDRAGIKVSFPACSCCEVSE